MGNDAACAPPVPGRADTAVVCVGLTLLVLLVFAEVGNFDFVSLDDPVHVYENPHVHTGLNVQNVAWAFGTHTPGQWHPLAYVSHQFVYEYFGSDARPHHLVSLAFHVASVVVLLLALRKMTGRLWPSAIVAAMFALHPLNVEPVAWICERRDVMCGLFWMLTLWAYAGYAQRGGRLRYFSVVLCCALALMSKPMAVTLPCVLLLLDLWPLRRTQFWTSPAADNVAGVLRACPPRSTWHLVLEKVPLLGLAAVSSVLSILSHRDAVVPFDVIPFHVRVAHTSVAYVVYLRKMIWPTDLCVWYPHPALQPSFQLSSLILAAVAAAAFLLAITIFVVYQARRRSYLSVGWFWYLGVIFPVSGLFQVGGHAYADRFTYLSLIGIYIVFAWGGVELFSKWQFGKLVVRVATPAVLLACMTATSIQLATWRDSRTLYEHALRKTRENSLIHYNLGNALKAMGRPEDALPHYQHAVRIRPDYAKAHYNLGNTLQGQGKNVEAIEHFHRVLRINPDDAEARDNLGHALEALGRREEALTHYQHAVRINPDFAGGRNSLGKVLVALGRREEALTHFQDALRINPDFAEARNNLGNILQALGRPKEALTHYQHAVRINPDDAEAHYNWGHALMALRRPEQALAHFQHAVRINPDFAEAHFNWGRALEACGRPEQALAHYQDAVRINPDDAEARNNLGNALQALGSSEQALAHYQHAVRIEPDFAQAHYNWGNALVALGRPGVALARYQDAVRIKLDYADAHYNWGNALVALGRPEEAIAHYQDAVRINPDDAYAYFKCGAVYGQLGKHELAVKNFDKAIELKPDFVQAYNNLAWLLATCPDEKYRDGQKAVSIARRACELLGWKNAHVLAALSAAYAESGQFAEAVKWQTKAIELAPAGVKAELQSHLKLYQARKPYRQNAAK